MDRPIKIRERASTYSTNKSYNAGNYLLATTLQSGLSFVSIGYRGRISDKFITENSGFLDLLEEGDLVLADKGLNIHHRAY